MTETTAHVERVARAMSDAEPVAWKCQERTMGAWYTRYVDERPTGERYRNIVPLYAAPQPHTAPIPHEQGRDEVERLREAAQIVLDRLSELEWSDDGYRDLQRDYFGHVEPAIDRLRWAIAALSPPLS